MDILSIKTRYKDFGIPDLETIDDIFADELVGSRRESDERNIRELAFQCGEPQILRPKIVSPTRDAVSLIDREERNV